MAFIKFTKSGYVCTEVDNYVLFRSERFKELFDFMYVDLTYLQTLVKDYVECLIDVDTFKVKEKPSDTALEFYSKEIKKELAKVHPFFAHIVTYHNNIAMDYINDLLTEPFSLTSLTFDPTGSERSKIARQIIIDIGAYSKLIDTVKQTQFCEDILLKTNFYDYSITTEKYRQRILDKINDREPERYVKATPAAEIKFAQETIRNLFYWILDRNNALVNNLSIAKRYMLYDEMFGFSFYPLFVSKTHKIVAYNPDADRQIMLANLQNEGNRLQKQKDGQLSASVKKDFERLKTQIQNSEEFFPATYSVNYLFDLLFLEFEVLMREKYKIRSCRNCGRYFIIKDLKNYYCDKVADNEKEPCNIIGKEKTYKNLLSKDPYLKIYQKYYRTKHAQRQRGKITGVEFANWLDAAETSFRNARLEKPPVEQFEIDLRKITLLK